MYPSSTKFLVLAAGACTVPLLGMIDRLTGFELSLSIFYIFPIGLVTWFVGKWPGIVISAASALVWLAADLSAGGRFADRFIPYWNFAIRSGFFVLSSLLLARLRSALLEERRAASHDSLTGVWNWKSFGEAAQKEIERSRRTGRPLSLVYIDLDNFKEANDTYGHTTGDLVLKTVAEVIRRNIRTVDSIARMGGDEFAVLMPETGEEGSYTVVERIRTILLETMAVHEWPVTFSIGISTFFRMPATVNELVKTADTLMYAAKREGKNTIRRAVIGR
jgi:diguanylate cyclase (GGDEF)-like protein